MIDITFRQNGELYLKAEGHAEFSLGDDIVCAAVSTLIETLASYISQKGNCHGGITLGKGYAEIIDGNLQDLPFFEITLHGLSLISADYPKNVRITPTCRF